MEFKLLTEEHELREYADLTYRFLDIRFPLEYLQRSRVRACVDDNGRILGGYMLVMEGPYRVVDSLPDSVRAKEPRFAPENLHKGFEITGLWMSPAVRKRHTNLLFWLRMYYDMLTLGRKWLVYAYSLDKPGLGRMYSVAKPTVIFRGETKMQEGMPEPDAESVEVVSIFNLAKAPFTAPQFLLRRLLPRQRRRAEQIPAPMLTGELIPVPVRADR
jgi:hypothetical protein